MRRAAAPLLTPNRLVLARHGELPLTPELEAHLGRISVATVQRRLTRFAQDTPRLPRKYPTTANPVARAIPMERIAWHEAEPGHFEVGGVHYSGPSNMGEYIHTLQLVDVATGWSEQVAVVGRSYQAMVSSFTHVLERLPFSVRELHPDNAVDLDQQHPGADDGHYQGQEHPGHELVETGVVPETSG